MKKYCQRGILFLCLISILSFIGKTEDLRSVKNVTDQKNKSIGYAQLVANQLAFHVKTMVENESNKSLISTTLVSLPYIEDFEGITTGDPGTLPTDWINDTADGTGDCAGSGGSAGAQECHDWQAHTGATPSSSPIGPNSDHTSGTGNYLYYEDSGNPNSQVNLLTPSFNLAGTDNPEISFWAYSQSNAGVVASVGGTVENKLHFDIMNAAGTTVIASDITMTIGDNDYSNWIQYAVNLTAYINSGTIRLRFRIENNTSTSGSHDIAIDDFIIQDLGIVSASGYACSVASNEIAGTIFEDFNFDGINDFGEDFGLSGIIVTATDSLGNASFATTDGSGNYSITSLIANRSYRVEFTNLPAGISPSFHGIDNGTTVQFTKPGNCVNLGVLDITNTCYFRDGDGGVGESSGWIYIGDTSNPADGSSYSTTVNGSSIVHNSANQIGRGAVNYEYWIMDRYIRVLDFLAFLNAVDPTNSTERWEGGLVADNTITYDSSQPIGERWRTLARNTCGQVMTAQEVEQMIVNYISFKVAARFANWAATGDINQGAYTFSNTYSADATITAIDANWEGMRLTEEDEVYKALYWDQANLRYNLYGTTTLEANGIPIQSDIDAAGLFTVANGNVYGLSNSCFKLFKTGQGGLSPYGLHFGMGDFHDMVIPYDVTLPMTTNVVRPNNQLTNESNMRSSFRLDTDLSYDNGFPSPGFRLTATANPCLKAIEIGNYIWEDTNGDGIQDGFESGIANIRVELYDVSGNLLAFDTTDANGQYYFAHGGLTDQHWLIATDSVQPNTMYYILVGQGQFSTNKLTVDNMVYNLTIDSTGSVSLPNLTDSDGEIGNGFTGGLVGLNDYPVTKITTGANGEVDHSFDFGFQPISCEIIDALTTDRTICSGELVDSLAVITMFNHPDSIAFVYFTSPQTDSSIIYTNGIGIDTIPINAGNDTVRLTDIAFPINSSTSPINYYVYAIKRPIPIDNTCRPYEEIVVTLNACDWGDLPDISASTNMGDYQTLKAHNGPVHIIDADLILGTSIDGEIDGQPTTNADGEGVDDDGINIMPSLNIASGRTLRLPLTATNNTGNTAHLEAWIDWNGDGIFSILSEMETDLAVNSGIDFPDYLEITIPDDAKTGSLLGFRIRLSTTNNMTPYGIINDGEVEDYLININCPQLICLPIGTVVKRE